MTRKTARIVLMSGGVLCALAVQAATPWNAQDYDLHSGDFNGDGKADLLYIAKSPASSSGIATSYESNLNTIWQSWPSNYLGIPWHGGQYSALVGDFNDDGKSDVLLQRATAGDSYLLLADANGRLSAISQTIGQSHLSLTWSKDQHTILPGDFSGVAGDDLFFQAATPPGLNAVPLSNSSGLFQSNPAQTFTNDTWPAFKWSRNHSVISVGDFNGDGRADLLIQARPNFVIVDYDPMIPVPVYSPNSFGVVYSAGGATPFQQAGVQQWSRNNNGVDWSPMRAVAIVGDFDNDGRDDVLLQARSAGRPNYLLTGNASGAAFSTPVTVTTNVIVSADGARLIAGRFGGSGAGAGVYVQATTASGTNYVATTVGSTTTAVVHDPAAMIGPVEIVSYSYDARGRLKTVARTGGVNNHVQTHYTYDKTNNRTAVVTTGSGNPP
jgi:hypothetical protein